MRCFSICCALQPILCASRLHEEVAAEHHLHLLGVANVALGRQHLENFEPHVVGLELDEDRGDGVHDGAHGEAALALPLGVVEVRAQPI